MFGTLEQFRYASCDNCECLQIVDIPPDLTRFYPSDYYSFNVKPLTDQAVPIVRAIQRARVRHRLFGKLRWTEKLSWRFANLPWAWNVLRPYLRGDWLPHGMDTRFLDVGCGNKSWWLEYLAQIGFTSMEGADPLISGDRTVNGIHYRKADLANLSGSYHFITFHHSLEHIPDQASALKAAADRLYDDGILMVRIPIFPNAVWQEYGEHWMSLDAPRHLYLHSLKSLALIADSAGLRLAEHFYDMDEFNLIGCEQYRLGLTLFGCGSYAKDRANSPITEAQVANWRARAADLNQSGTADQATFLMIKKVASRSLRPGSPTCRR